MSLWPAPAILALETARLFIITTRDVLKERKIECYVTDASEHATYSIVLELCIQGGRGHFYCHHEGLDPSQGSYECRRVRESTTYHRVNDPKGAPGTRFCDRSRDLHRKIIKVHHKRWRKNWEKKTSNQSLFNQSLVLF